MEKRFCRKHKKEILNETDNTGKFFCDDCGMITKSRTYTEPVTISNEKISLVEYRKEEAEQEFLEDQKLAVVK